jgi:hypothetical protein
MSSCVCPSNRNPNWISSKTFRAVNNDKNLNKNWFLLSFGELSDYRKSLLGRGSHGSKASVASGMEELLRDFPCINFTKKRENGRCSNNAFEFLTTGLSRHRMQCVREDIVKFKSLGHKSVEKSAYVPSPRPWVSIRVTVMGSCPNPLSPLLWSSNGVEHSFDYPCYHEWYIVPPMGSCRILLSSCSIAFGKTVGAWCVHHNSAATSPPPLSSSSPHTKILWTQYT